jgi:hypothetical protein
MAYGEAMPRAMRALARFTVGISMFGTSCGARTELTVASPTDAGSDVLQADSAPPSLDASCGAVGSAPQVLASFGTGAPNGPTLWSLAITRGAVFVDATDASNSPLAVYRVPLGGGTPMSLVSGQSGCPSMSPFATESPLAADDASLYMVSADFTATCQGSSPTVTTYNVATAALGSVPAPSTTAALNVTALWATPGDRGVYYLTGSEFDPSTTDLVHWDGATSAIVSSLPQWSYALQVVGTFAFALGRNALYKVPLTGGAATEVAELDPDAGTPTLLGANSTALFYTPDGARLVRLTAQTGDTTEITSLTSVSYGPSWADDRYVYFGGYEPPSGLVMGGLYRVPAGGGAVEAFWTDGTVRAVMAFGCAVYWLTDVNFGQNLPSQLLVAAE